MYFSDDRSVNTRCCRLYYLLLRELIKAKHGNVELLASIGDLSCLIGVSETSTRRYLSIIRKRIKDVGGDYSLLFFALDKTRHTLLKSRSGALGAAALTHEQRVASRKLQIERHGTSRRVGGYKHKKPHKNKGVKDPGKSTEKSRVDGRKGYDKTLSSLPSHVRSQNGLVGRLRSRYRPTQGELFVVELLTHLGRYTDSFHEACHGKFTHYESHVFPDKQYVSLLDGSRVLPDFVTWELVADKRVVRRAIEVYGGKQHSRDFLQSVGKEPPMHYWDPDLKVAMYRDVGIDAIVLISTDFESGDWTGDFVIEWLNKAS